VTWASRFRFRTGKHSGTGHRRIVWEPFLLAERWKAGAQVLVQFHDPITDFNWFAIQSAIAFSDNYGLGIPNFVYNVAHQQFDRILLCCETPASSVDPACLRRFPLSLPCRGDYL
jgi:hypothetical protein